MYGVMQMKIYIWVHLEQSGAISIQDKRKCAKNLLAEGFYSFLFALHHTPLLDINFELLLGKLVGSFQANCVHFKTSEFISTHFTHRY